MVSSRHLNYQLPQSIPPAPFTSMIIGLNLPHQRRQGTIGGPALHGFFGSDHTPHLPLEAKPIRALFAFPL